MTTPSYESNKQFERATQFVLYTRQSVFVTGKAGTGKTTFLKHLKSHTLKNTVVAAPTGIAAINAGGSTLHSLFQLPLKPFLPTRSSSILHSELGFCDQQSLFTESRYNQSKIELFRKMEILIIDEVSMVRVDTMDAVDLILRKFRGSDIPFGGVQLVLIGDLYQLPPVVKPETWSIMSSFYPEPFFFESHAIKKLQPEIIELTKIYRQSDDTFISVLNRIRTNTTVKSDLEYLNSFLNPSFRPKADEAYITLTTHNEKSEATNRYQLRQLPGTEKIYSATIEDEFPNHIYPADANLHLKIGAQVMFIRNSRGEERSYYNGMLARITALEEDSITVQPAGSDTELKVVRDTWKNIRYGLSKETNEVNEFTMGAFIQYPLRLAWAITIHKSQGLTFDRAIIDAGDSFAPGQVYVALSRLRSTKEMVLKSTITEAGIKIDDCVNQYLNSIKDEAELDVLLKKKSSEFFTEHIISSFGFKDVTTLLQQHQSDLMGRASLIISMADTCLSECIKGLQYLDEVAGKFEGQLRTLSSLEGDKRTLLLEKIIKGAIYFSAELRGIKSSLETLHERVTQIKSSKSYQKDLNLLLFAVNQKLLRLQQSNIYANGILSGNDADTLATNARKEENRFSYVQKKEYRARKPAAGETRFISLRMFKEEGKSIETIAQERGLVLSTIETHLASFMATGDILLQDLVSEAEAELIEKAIIEVAADPEKKIRTLIGEHLSYGKVNAVKEALKLKVVKV